MSAALDQRGRLVEHLGKRRRLLASVWTLRDCRDVEDVARAALIVAIRRWKPQPSLSASEFEDTLRHLLGEVHALDRHYDERIVRARGYVPHDAGRAGPGTSHFTGYLSALLPYRAIDYWRHVWGRQGQYRLYELDGAREPDELEPDDGADPLRRLPGSQPDPADDWLAACAGLDAAGDRPRAGAAPGLGLQAGRRAANGTDRAGAGRRDTAGRTASSARVVAYLDCACGWRTYREAPNGQPGWHWPERCLGCGAKLRAAA